MKNKYSIYFNDKSLGKMYGDGLKDAFNAILERKDLPEDHLDNTGHLSDSWTGKLKYIKYKDDNKFTVVVN